MRAAAWWRRYLDWRLRNVRRLILDEHGFALVARQDRQHMSWRDISAVTAYKRDLFTTDLLCLAVAGHDRIVELDEQMEGYAAVEAQLCERLCIGLEWKLAVLFPAFAPCPRRLYPREAAA